MLAAIAFAVWLPQLDSKIDYSPETARLEVIAKDLGAKLKMRIGYSKELQDEVLAIAVKGVSGRELIERISQSLNATTTYSANEVVIAQTNEQHKETERLEVLRRKERIESSLRRYLKENPISPEFNAKELALKVTANWKIRDNQDMNWYRTARLNESSSPYHRFARSVVSQMPVGDLAQVPIGNRTVFAVPSNRIQTALKVDLGPLVRKLIDEQAAYAQAISDSGAKADQATSLASDMVSPIDQGLKKVLVIADSRPFQGLMIKVQLVDAKGLLSSILLPVDQQSLESLLAPSSEPDIEVNLGPLAKEWGDLLVKVSSGAAAAPSPAVLDRLRHMDEQDPLGLAMTGVARTVLEKRGENVVANLGDEAIITLMVSALRGKPTLKVTERLLHYTRHEVVEQDGWWTVSQREPLANRQSRFDRKSLAEFIRYTDKVPEVGLDDLAALVAKQPEAAELEMLSFLILGPLNRIPLGQMQLQDPWLRFYGTLTADQRKVEKLVVGDLSASQKRALARVAYGRDSQWSYRMTKPLPAGSRPLFMTEGTEVLPNGLTNDLVVAMTRREDEVVLREKAAGGRGEAPSELAWTLFMRERPDLFPQQPLNQPEGPNSKYRLATRTEIGFSLVAPPSEDGTTFTRTGNQVDFRGAKGSFVAYDQLPEAFRQKVAKLLDEYRKTYKDAKPGEFGGPARKTPPPTAPKVY